MEINGQAERHRMREEITRLRCINADLLEALEDAATHITEMGCTCVERSHGHQRDCMGVAYAKPARAIIRRAEGE